MSAQASKKLPDLVEDQVNDLLREYTTKLVTLRERADALAQELAAHKPGGLGGAKPKWNQIDSSIQLLDLWKMMRPAALRLARYVSQTIEHGRIDEVTDLELRLRLPEYEHHLRFLDDRVRYISTFLGSIQHLYAERSNEIAQAIFLP